MAASVSIDGTGRVSAETGVAFVDHLISALGRHSMFDVDVKAESLDGITHHLIEDAAIGLASAIDGALGDRSGIRRFGHAAVPMDESLAEASVDLVRRPFHRLDLPLDRPEVEGVPAEDLLHFFDSLLRNLNCCAHLSVRYGTNDHHRAESAAKSLAAALREAAAPDPGRGGEPPSTKGTM